MKESLHIKNFGPIKEVRLEDVRPLTVIIGTSGSGKSTIMKVLCLFRWLYKMHNVRSYLKLSNIAKSPFRFQWKSYERNNGWEGFTSKQSFIEYQRGDITIRLQDNGLKFEGQPSLDNLHLEKLCFIADNRIASSMVLAKRMRSDNFYLNETISDFSLAMDALNHYEMPFFELQLEKRKTSNGVRYMIEGKGDNKYNIPFTSASSGIQSILPVAATAHYFATQFDMVKTFNSAVLRYVSDADRLGSFKPIANIGEIKSRRVCLHIEEPELSLSPEKQTALLNTLVASCFTQRKSRNEYDMGIFFTTHSPYIINQLNLLVHAYEQGKKIDDCANISFDDVEVYRLEYDGTLRSLKARNMNYIDTMPLSDEINRIYDDYDNL